MSNKKAKRRKAKRRRARLKIKKKVFTGVARIHTTFTNYIITMTDLKGNALCWSSSGQCGFKGKKKDLTMLAKPSVEILVLKPDNSVK